jgi:hypothetical protein
VNDASIPNRSNPDNDYWEWLVDDTSDVGWVHELVQRKGRGHAVTATGSEEASAAALSAVRARLWREIMTAVEAFNEATGTHAIVASFSPSGHITLAKDDLPAGYLDVEPDHAASTFLVTVKLRKSEAAPVVEHVTEGQWIVRDGKIHLLWFRIELSPAELVRRVLTPFFDEI